MSFHKKIFYFIIFIFILFFFLYFRLKPIYLQNIPYTYDQGRDFLKAQEIVLYKNPTFIGPTTGIMGIYHGVWWYYLLSFAFFIFNGSPLGFAYTIFFLHTLAFLLFYFFLKKEVGFYSALLFLIITAFSPYFSFISNFVINSGFTIPFIFLLLFAFYQYLKQKKDFYLFLIFLSSGFIFEAQVSFGLFLIPSVFLIILLINLTKNNFKKNRLKSFIYFCLGLIIPFLPRLLFEIKNNFLQTKTFINFFLHPRYFTEKDFFLVFQERFSLFKDFYLRIFINQFFAYGFLVFTLIVLFFLFKKLNKNQQVFLKTNFFLILFIFFLSLFYKDNFWSNYLEGFSIFYLPFIIFAFYLALKQRNYLIKLISYGLLCLFIAFNLIHFSLEIKNNRKLTEEGLIKQQKVIKKLYQINNYQNFCLRIYTPPVIPYTYQYLVEYYSRTKKYPKPQNEFINNQCWYIIEDDKYKFLIDKWRRENIPNNYKKINSIQIYPDILLELWSI